MRTVLSTALQSAPRGTQTQIADALGVRVQTVNKWAQGYNLPEPQHLPQLEQLLRLKKGTLTSLVGTAARPPRADDDTLDQILQMLIRVNDRLGVVLEKLEGPEPGRDAPGAPAAPSAPAKRVR